MFWSNIGDSEGMFFSEFDLLFISLFINIYVDPLVDILEPAQNLSYENFKEQQTGCFRSE